MVVRKNAADDDLRLATLNDARSNNGNSHALREGIAPERQGFFADGRRAGADYFGSRRRQQNGKPMFDDWSGFNADTLRPMCRPGSDRRLHMVG